MSLKSKILAGFFLVTGILVLAGAVNIVFFLRMNHSIDELVEKRFVIEQKVQSGHLIINKIYNKIWDTLLLKEDQREGRIKELDMLALSFYEIMDEVSGYLPYPSGNIRDQKRNFQTYYILGKDILTLPDGESFQEHGEKMERFRHYKERVADQIDKRFEGYKNEFAAALADLQTDTYLVAAVSILSVIFSAMAALILSIRLSSNLVKPVLDLTAAIHRFTSGNKEVMAHERPDDEIGRLGAAFNRMTRQLNESIQNLETQIIERKQAEKEALRRQEQLVQADRMASLGILVSGVAHEINNPNQFILSHIEPLKNAWDGAIPVLDRYYKQYGDFRLGGANYSLIREKISGIFLNISTGSRRIKAIVDELRDFVNERPQDGKAEVNLNDIADSALTLISNMIKNATHDFSFVREDALPLVPGHYQRLEQVMVNLLQNACQALASPGESIRIMTFYDKGKNQVGFQVMDQGVGIPEENLAHLTDPFFTTKRDQGGTGLGLSISSRIITDHNGTMTFESVPGKGTRVTVRLPVKKEKE